MEELITNDESYSGERFLPSSSDKEMFIEHMQRYSFVSSLVKGKTVLDAACGEGYGTDIISRQAKQVYGLDLDFDTIDRAKKRYEKDNVSFVVSSIEKLPFEDNTFDVIISFETLEHVNEEAQNAFFSEIKRTLKSDGMLIISTPNKKVYTDLVNGKNKYHVKELYVDQFKQLIGDYFENYVLLKQYPNVAYVLEGDNKTQFDIPAKEIEEARYVIAVCSDTCIDISESNTVVEFDDSMYYFLNLEVHNYEEKVLNLKAEAESFEKKQESEIKKLQAYITDNLEPNLSTLKDYTKHLEKDIAELNNTVRVYQEESARYQEESARYQEESARNRQEAYIYKEQCELYKSAYEKTLRYKIGNLLKTFRTSGKGVQS